MKLRVSPDRDWKHLLAPYREHFLATFGPVRYKADNRWIATDYLNRKPGKPSAATIRLHGFHPAGPRRVDRARGVEDGLATS